MNNSTDLERRLWRHYQLPTSRLYNQGGKWKDICEDVILVANEVLTEQRKNDGL